MPQLFSRAEILIFGKKILEVFCKKQRAHNNVSLPFRTSNGFLFRGFNANSSHAVLLPCWLAALACSLASSSTSYFRRTVVGVGALPPPVGRGKELYSWFFLFLPSLTREPKAARETAFQPTDRSGLNSVYSK